MEDNERALGEALDRLRATPEYHAYIKKMMEDRISDLGETPPHAALSILEASGDHQLVEDLVCVTYPAFDGDFGLRQRTVRNIEAKE